jgi:hypothetical protein
MKRVNTKDLMHNQKDCANSQTIEHAATQTLAHALAMPGATLSCQL